MCGRVDGSEGTNSRAVMNWIWGVAMPPNDDQRGMAGMTPFGMIDDAVRSSKAKARRGKQSELGYGQRFRAEESNSWKLVEGKSSIYC